MAVDRRTRQLRPHQVAVTAKTTLLSEYCVLVISFSDPGFSIHGIVNAGLLGIDSHSLTPPKVFDNLAVCGA